MNHKIPYTYSQPTLIWFKMQKKIIFHLNINISKILHLSQFFSMLNKQITINQIKSSSTNKKTQYINNSKNGIK